jgi:TetR/AcrR family transcriptional regulator, regulator of cefoperazone and chloramphenicol sensitivity
MERSTGRNAARSMTGETAPRRHPAKGGYARGEETRARIVAAALRVFGEEGYDHVSTRRIAASAGVNPPALQYYFGGKEGLHRACGQHIIDRITAVVSPALAQAGAVPAGARARAVEALCGLLSALVDGLAEVGSETWGRFIERSKAEAGPAMAMIHECVGQPLMEAAARLVGIATGRSPRDALTRLRAYAIVGQVSSIRAHREYLLKSLNWPQFDARAVTLIKAVVNEHTRAALGVGIGAAAPVPVRRRRRGVLAVP